MKLLNKFLVFILCFSMILGTGSIVSFAATDKIGTLPAYPDNACIEISKTGITATYGDEYKEIANRFCFDFTENPIDLSDAEYIEFDMFIENYTAFKSAFNGKNLSFNISSSAANKNSERKFFTFPLEDVTRNGWNHIKLEILNVTEADLSKITYVFLASGGGDSTPSVWNTTTRIANVCGTRVLAITDNVYSDNMIFQQNKPFDITGVGVTGVTVKAELLSDLKQVIRTGMTTVNKNGKWTITLDSMVGGYESYSLKLYFGPTATHTINNVRFGEVYIANGQSNMQYKLWETTRGAEMYKNNSYNQPNISVFILKNGSGTGMPVDPDKNYYSGSWIVGDNRDIHDVSAVAYYFAEELQAKLDVPVGVMDVSLGATSIFAWISRKHIEADEKLLTYLKNQGTYYTKSAWGGTSASQTMSALYNTRVYTCSGLKVAGMIWYQGCNEVGTPKGVYENALKVLRKCYADTFNYEGDMPFVLSHLAPYGYSGVSLPQMWDEMTNATKNNANMSQVTIYDLPTDWNYGSWAPEGKGANPNPIHPMTKEPIGDRMAEVMYSLVYDGEYGAKNTPLYSKMEIKGESIYVDFKNVGDGLASSTGSEVRGFSIAGKDGVFVNAQAEVVDKNTLRVWNDGVTEPKNVAYAYDRYCVTANLYSTQNGGLFLPAAPFITTDKVTVYPANTSWYDVDEQEIVHYESNYQEKVAAWISADAACEVVNDVKDRGTGSLKVSYTGENSTVQIKSNFVNSSGKTFVDFNRNYSENKAIKFKVKNTGSAINLQRLIIHSGATYYVPINTALSEDSGWVDVTADFTKLEDSNGKEIDYAKLTNVTQISLRFTDIEAAGAVYVDTFQLVPAIKHGYAGPCDEECYKCGETRTVKHQYETTTTKATQTKNGSVKKMCTLCGKISSNKTIGRINSVKLSATSYTYNGKAKTPTVTVKDTANNVLKKDTDYTVKYATGRKNAGTYKVTVTFKGKYSGTKTLSFKINPISISKCSVKLSTAAYTYNGKVKTPAVTVMNASGNKLTKNTHYTVTYASGRKNVGKYKVTVKGKGNYSGTKTLYFKINPVKTTVSKLTAGKKSLKVGITKKSTQVTGYQVQYSTSKTFKSAKTKTVSSYKTTSTTLSKLSAKKTYYVRVRTYKTVNGTKYYSGWSSYKYKKTK